MKKSESVNPNLLLKEYRSKIDSKVILRDVELENLKKQAVWIQDKIKNSDFSAQIVQLAKFKEVKYNEGDAIVDWELIKFFSLQMKNASRNVLVINFEAIFFCEWEFDLEICPTVLNGGAFVRSNYCHVFRILF